MLVVARVPLVARACARPKKNKIKAKDIKAAIKQANLLCFNFEDTIECRLAWERVEELSSSYHDQWMYELDQRKRETEAEIDEARRLAFRNREYDL